MKVKELISILNSINGELRIINNYEENLLGVYVGLDDNKELFASIEVD